MGRTIVFCRLPILKHWSVCTFSLAEELHRALRPGGTLVLSGFPDRHLDRIAASFGPPREVLERSDWRAVICA